MVRASDENAPHADWLCAHDGRGHVYLPRGELVFAGDSIIYAGFDFPGPVDRRIDFGCAFIGPGFVDLDALGDVDSEVLTFDRGPGHLLGRVWTEKTLRQGPDETFTPDEERWKYRYAFTRLLRNGITSAVPITSMLYRAWAESYDEIADVAAIAAEMGIRVWLGPCYMSGLTYQDESGALHQYWDAERGMSGLRDAERFIANFHGAHSGLVSAALLPDRIETQLPQVLERTARIQRDSGVPLRIHCCQSAYEFETVVALRGTTPLGWLEGLGLLTDKAILPHGIYLSGHPRVSIQGEDDLLRLADLQATVAHCPVVFGRDGELLASFARMCRRGVRFGMGTDTQPPDMIENIRLGRIFNAVADQGPTATAGDFYTAATLGGAAALGRTDIGRLSIGTKADIAVFALDDLQLGPIDDPITALTIAGSGRDCRSVWVNGVERVKDFAVIGADAAGLRATAAGLYEKLARTHASRAPGSVDPRALFTSVFPVKPNPRQ